MTNMSIPLRITPRPVKKLRAAPTAKWESIAIENAVHTAARPESTRNGATGMSAPIAVAAPVTHPSLNGVAHATPFKRSEEHTSELQSRPHLVCRLLLEKKKHPPFDSAASSPSRHCRSPA